jgi:hypothetical protein
MAKPIQKKKPARSNTTSATPPPKSKAASRVATENGRLIGLTLAGTVLSLVIAFPPLSPLLLTAPVVRPLLRRVRSKDPAAATSALWRWALTVFVTILVSGAFVRDRMLSAFPFASQAANAMEQAISGAGAAPVGFAEVILGTVAFVALAAASLGVAACILMSIALGTAAAAATVLFSHGNNVLLISLVACPAWQWAQFAAATLAFVPAVAVGRAKLYGIGVPADAGEWLKRRAIIAGGLFLAAVLLRLILAGPYLALIRNWTLP